MPRTRDLSELVRRWMAADPDLGEAIEGETFNALVAMQVYEARTEAKLTQKQLADRVGTQQSVISRIEDADYDGHSLSLLKRIAKALGKKLRVEFYSCDRTWACSVTDTFSPDWEAPGVWQPEVQQTT